MNTNNKWAKGHFIDDFPRLPWFTHERKCVKVTDELFERLIRGDGSVVETSEVG